MLRQKRHVAISCHNVILSNVDFQTLKGLVQYLRFISMLYSEIQIGIDTNNDELV
jgi:hypothetical protein